MDNLDQYTVMTKQLVAVEKGLAAVEKQRRSAIEQHNEQAAEKKRRAQQLREKEKRAVEATSPTVRCGRCRSRSRGRKSSRRS
jgi:hypothetical protein